MMNSEYPSSGRANYILFLLVLAYLVSFIDRQILSLMVVPIRRDLGISDFQMSLLQGASFALFYATLGLPLGWLADRYRRTTIIGVGAAVWGMMTMLCGLARNFGALFLARVGVGVGEAALSPAAYSLLSDIFPPHRLARAMGIFTLGLSLGGGLGYIIGGTVVDLVTQSPPGPLPLVGSMQAWQITFLMVGAPGIVIALFLLALSEPARLRKAGIDEPAAEERAPAVMAVFSFVVRHWRVYGPIFLSVVFLSLLGYGTLNWYPTFLIRSFGLPVRDVGLYFGLLYLICGTAGAVGAPLLAEHLDRRGRRDANLRTIMLVSTALAPFAVLGPLMPTLTLALIFAAPAVLLLNAFFGVSIAALQLVTPNRMRGLVSAIFLLTNNLAGLAIGSSLVPFITDFVFHDETMLKYSLSIVALVVCPLAAISAARGLSSYRDAVSVGLSRS